MRSILAKAPFARVPCSQRNPFLKVLANYLGIVLCAWVFGRYVTHKTSHQLKFVGDFLFPVHWKVK